jgi:hypothetical protein
MVNLHTREEHVRRLVDLLDQTAREISGH